MKNTRKLIVCTLGILVGTLTTTAGFASAAPDRSFIVGGVQVPSSDPIAATTVFLSGADSDGTYFCSASIIAQDMLVTAAHCVYGSTEGSLRAIFMQKVTFNDDGTPAFTDISPEVHLVPGATYNPGYDPNATGADQHDIAIVHFSGGLPAGYTTATFMSPSESLSVGETVTLAGYGSTDAINPNEGGELDKVDVTIASMLGSTEVVLDQSQGKGACFGDSGGPAFVMSGGQPELWGLTNRAYPNDVQDCAHESVYTKINSYTNWIAQTENALRQQN
jgi:secreted trypsin-like serine protease